MRRVSPHEAHALLEHEGFVYLDVRTPTEFAEGHPPRAFNVPWTLIDAHGARPNPHFVREVAALFRRDQAILVGCASGIRSLAAAEQLVREGFSNVVEQRAGMDGVRDAFGRVKELGWRAAGLPVALEEE